MYTAVATPKMISEAASHARCVLSMRTSSVPFVNRSRLLRLLCLVRILLKQAGEKFPRVHAMSRVVRTRVYTTRLGKLRAEIAGRSLLFDHRFFRAWRPRDVCKHVERVHINVAVRTILGAP